MKNYTDVTFEYLDKATPGEGAITYEPGYSHERHKEEIQIAEWIIHTLGGDICLIDEKPSVYGARTPDYEWKGRFWELKSLKSDKAVDAALRKAISQIYERPGGVILDFGKNQISLSRVESAVKSRVETSCRFRIDVMIICGGSLSKVIRFA